MKTKIHRYAWGPTLVLLTILFACSPPPQAPDDRESSPLVEEVKAGPGAISASSAVSPSTNQLPVRFQTPAYTVTGNKELTDILGNEEEFTVKVGADISSTSGPVILRDIMKKLAALKNMNVSWASDVDQYSYVDVDIRADDDFFKSLDNLLRQRDYFHEVQGNTIVIKYKETRKFHLSVPFVNSKYDASVGATVSKNSQSKITNNGNSFDIWDNVKKNLDVVLQIWEDTSASQQPTPAHAAGAATPAPAQPATATAAAGTQPADQTAAAAKVSRPQSAKGYYTIDKPIGLVTVTAPRPIMEKVENYINNLKTELYKQVSIEAKILEVSVNDQTQIGIDWESLLKDKTIEIKTTFGSSTASQPLGPSGSRSFTITGPTFNLLINAIEKQGKTRVLSNPRISVLNGQPAMINVSQQFTYVKKVTQSANADTGTVEYEIDTDEKSSGVVMSIVPTILADDEVVLNLIPVTSTVNKIEYKSFGTAEVGLPDTSVREMSTMVKVKQGEMLVVGGLIDTTDGNSDSKVPLMSRLPLIGKLFGLEKTSNTRKELVILLKPEIIS